MKFEPSNAVAKKFRTRKEDSAFVYNLLESYEGVASYSTLPHSNGDLHRDLELSIPIGMLAEAERVLESLGELVYEIK